MQPGETEACHKVWAWCRHFKHCFLNARAGRAQLRGPMTRLPPDSRGPRKSDLPYPLKLRPGLRKKRFHETAPLNTPHSPVPATLLDPLPEVWEGGEMSRPPPISVRLDSSSFPGRWCSCADRMVDISQGPHSNVMAHSTEDSLMEGLFTESWWSTLRLASAGSHYHPCVQKDKRR